MVTVCALADIHAGPSLRITKNKRGLQTFPADILVVAGDLTARGSLEELAFSREWIKSQPQKHKIVIAGNHDFCLEDPKRRQEAENILSGDGIIYLRDQMVVVEGLRIYGTPWQPWFYDWAFNLERGAGIAAKWALIPENLDLLVTHGPPFGYGDKTHRGESVGCKDLLEAIDLKKPRHTVYGHIHEDAGQWTRNGCTLTNCTVGYTYDQVRDPQPVLLEIEPCTTGFTE